MFLTFQIAANEKKAHENWVGELRIVIHIFHIHFYSFLVEVYMQHFSGFIIKVSKCLVIETNS